MHYRVNTGYLAVVASEACYMGLYCAFLSVCSGLVVMEPKSKVRKAVRD